MTKYKLHIHDRTYTEWTWILEDPVETSEKPEISPTKMFSKDIILYDPQTKTHTTTYSHVRSQTPLAGILVLQGNRTYGRVASKNKLLYKVIPDDKLIITNSIINFFNLSIEYFNYKLKYIIYLTVT